MDTSTARMLASYRAWADTLTYQAVAQLPPGEASKERRNVFGSIVGTLNHNLLVDRIWQAHLEGRRHGFKARNAILYSDLDELQSEQQLSNRWWIDWSARQDPTTLAEAVKFRFMSGADGVMTRAAMLLHVVNHGTYHRGWLAEMFFEIPAKIPTTDLPVFLQQQTGQ
jgi:uncharacterized damage-inducible protein DinB